MSRKGKVFIDTNILFYASQYHIKDVFQWIESLYEEIYIHQMVLDELISSTARSKVESKLKEGQWILFDPDDEETLSDEQFAIYEGYLSDVKQAFVDLDEKKKSEGRRLKNTNDLGEMHSLAAAMLIGASIIFSNDYDVLEVIHDAQLCITLDETEESVLIDHDSLLDFCCYLVDSKLESKGPVKKFLKLFQGDKVIEFDTRINEKESTSKISE
ncbi:MULTISPECIES: PIN domain-containing protein [Lysinibacillus]|uniref:PIN domain-containing protein n=1 Tax=Lysinibacillus sphaericus (strain C3-41) TaxID=444177 RepID=B1I092_LYSSC|nr:MULTISPECIES: PIN domain-containing protein [Lysinibacillus]MBE5085738.1 PIN domain-containing protein [Bacillus thuringiensis]ACA42251.1 hypothetical protein Bsph_p021 [Lysinibacillus sphaericus C3-41]AMO35395.1 hypothetical protein AR327_23170 [Lysinibacillus sphaericus]AMR93172.1 hypothetical protein A1T07_23485 [Lysinibacillus sphaericus]KGA83752.1 hypothetical protein KQ41_06865 [Lysinibacillus fusiformis]